MVKKPRKKQNHPKPNPNKARPGNLSAVKLKTDELKLKAYEAYCAHLAKGKSKKSFWYEEGDISAGWMTMEKYISESSVLNPNKKEKALANGLAVWEEICEDGAKGLNKDVNTATLQMVMRNKFGWDKETGIERTTSKPMVQQLLDHWKK